MEVVEVEKVEVVDESEDSEEVVEVEEVDEVVDVVEVDGGVDAGSCGCCVKLWEFVGSCEKLLDDRGK